MARAMEAKKVAHCSRGSKRIRDTTDRIKKKTLPRILGGGKPEEIRAKLLQVFGVYNLVLLNRDYRSLEASRALICEHHRNHKHILP